MKKTVFIAFIGLLCIQWIVPLKMIFDNGRILERGRIVRFKTQPIDPTDPFIGKYITLNFETETLKTNASSDWKRGEDVYVFLKEDQNGFAQVDYIGRNRPSTQSLFVKATVAWATSYNDSLEVRINYPFDKFFMDEYKAPAAEHAYMDANIRNHKDTAYALVSILEGDAVLKDVMINGKSIKSLVKGKN